MERIFTRIFFLAFTFCCLITAGALAQTITIGNIDPGPYGRGSTIGVPFHLNTSTACASSTNVFNLYLSDANGNFGAPKLIGNYTGFYGTFVNGVIPATTTASTKYRIRIQSTDPAIAPATSGFITVNAVTGVMAAASSQQLNATAAPEVYGSCIGADNTPYPFVDASTTGSAVTLNFFNELAQADEGTITLPAPAFNAKAANYTVFVKAVNGGVVGTKAYSLINNAVNNSFGASGSNQVCLNGQNKLTYSVDINSPNGIQKNYPGLIYNVNWGDGFSTNYTLCDIVAAGGFIEHTYKKSSCGNSANGLQNVFQIDLQPTSTLCGKLGTPVTGYARIIQPPSNKITSNQTACTNTPVKFTNSSIPGQDPNSTSFDCTNQNALYTWIVDGNVVAVNYKLDKQLEYTFTTNGQHFVGLHLQNPNAICEVKDVVVDICIQNPPKPSFTLPGSTICTSGSVTPINTSVIDEPCFANSTYNWVVKGPAAVGYLNGTNANSKSPTFNFNSSGVYTVELDITTNSCGLVQSELQEVVINLAPTASLSPNALVCGKDQTITFDPNATTTKTSLTGTSKALPTTYNWVITGGAFTYVNGTDANTKYPQVKFSEYKTYTITVTHVNNCNTVGASDTQKLTFQQSPDVQSGGDQTICEGNPVTLPGVITGSVISYQWVGGAGTFSPSRNVLQPTYTPTAAEITAGSVTLSLEATTNLAAPCNIITSAANITIINKDKITSALTAEVCTGTNFKYTIKSKNPASTYTWTASVTTGSATGFGTTGSGNTINDLITDTGVGDAVVTYIITPSTNGCPGIPFTLELTVNRIPVLTATAPPAPICTGSPNGIMLGSNQPNTTYTWTSVASPGVTGNTNQATEVAAIGDVLVNLGTTYGTVTYTITPYHGACPGQPRTVVVSVAPLPIPAIAGPDETICNGPVYTLQANNPSPGIGTWSLASGQSGITFSNPNSPTATVSGLLPGNVYKFVWSINTSPGCPPTTSTVTITTDAPSVGGTAAGDATVCADANAGQLTLTGNVGNVTGWESSTDGGLTWVIHNVALNQYNYSGLTQTTQFRAIVKNGVCGDARSTIATVTVNQPVMAANGGNPITTLCNASTVTLNGNDPSPFVGIWTQTGGPPVVFADANNPKTQVTGLIGGNTYTFVWTIKGTAPCADSQNAITVVNKPDVTPGFTFDNTKTVCGPVTIKFTNTSTPVFTTTDYLWDFGDGTGNTNEANPKHTFLPRTDGRDTTYTISLSIINNCFPRPAFTMTITVRPSAPIASLLPERLSACGALAIKVKNTSPGNNDHYDFFVYDGNVKIFQITKTDKTDVTFPSLEPPKNDLFYTVYVIATDFCGNTSKSTPIPINIFPATFVPLFFAKDNSTAACFPFTATFVNISSGGDTFIYHIYDAPTGGKELDRVQGSKTEQPYTFTAPGVYYVSIQAFNPCAQPESAERIKFEAYPKPAPDFNADIREGCKAIRVSFANLTPVNGQTPPQSLSYEWDFGDGSAHFIGYTPLPHLYIARSTAYTVTLKVTNLATGCTDMITKPDFIKVDAAPTVDFSASPGFITKIPNYHFAFDDQTSGNPVSWRWDFGDKTFSTEQNPAHTYADTGTYKVTLRVVNREGCDSTVSHNVQITGIPGQLYIPNAFMPASSTTELRTFVIKGSGIESWRLQIFNNYGQLVWETTKLDEKGQPVESWDGLYKGVPAQQGVYIWQASAHFINGTDWKGMQYGPKTLPKRTGVIHLIR
ncbi:PKD domain-containing protein [Mucilaginibacter psychrotolerans]|uniref:PKD domain-containing protein n=1 Tax=Mucilaginibacter psychrotolerans TaxID=1524096 RepID=A0A4Y8S7D4_9SPHI|nr:PKD domain-containing protein [Mucilaginibacter psychrotolerans]TFF34933.1 PKD domain-containing protein [Mucilaginibacter psychrotolerans]